MTTIIRVKRHRGEDPVEALVLSCKRQRTEDNLLDSSSDSFKKILSFSGTVEEKDDKIAASTVESFTKESKYSELRNKHHIPEIRLKQRREWKERSEDNRFTLLSCLRSSNAFEAVNPDAPGEGGKSVAIVDVHKENNIKSAEHNTSESSYVYDLYSTHFESDSDFNDLYLENLLSVQPLECELEYRNGEDCYEEVDPDEDDSNDENNWRNDYPDTELDEEDEDGNLLVNQLEKFHLDYDLSSDSGEEKYLHYVDEDNYCYYEAEDLAGKRYAKYKANAMKHLMENDDKGSEDDDNDADDEEDDFRDCEDFSYCGNSD